MNFKDMVRGLLRKSPRPDAINSLSKAQAFKKIHTDCIKKFKDGKCTEQQAASIHANLSVFY